jgi:hypothetical protein
MHKTPRFAAACATAFAACAAGAAELQPMDVMGPTDTPAVAADRIALPEQASDAGRQHSEFAIERAYAASDGTGLTGIYPLDEGGDRKKPDKPEKPEKPDKPGG